MQKERKNITVGIHAQTICPNSGPDTESVSQYTVSNQQKMNDFDAITRPCTTSVHAPIQPDSEPIAPRVVQTP